MIGAKLYIKKQLVYLHLLMYGLLALAGVGLLGKAFARGEKASGVLGFVVVFGMGMFVMTLIKSRRAQVAVYKDFMELRQSRRPQMIRYRNLVAVSRPDQKRLVLTLHEDNERKSVTVWLKELSGSDIDMLEDFLRKSRGKG